MPNYFHLFIFVIKLISASREGLTEEYLHSIGGKWKANVLNKHYKPENRLFSMQRCFMICPIDVMCFSDGSTDIPGQAIESSHEFTHKIELHKSTTRKATTYSHASSLNGANKSTTPIPGKRQKKQPKHKYIHGIINFDNPALNTIWRRKLLLELKKSNSHAKRTYKFRQFSPSGCYVVCHHLQGTPFPSQSGFLPNQISQQNTNQPTGGETEATENPSQPITEESDETEDDSYVEGEDEPIEITASPPDSQDRKNLVKIT